MLAKRLMLSSAKHGIDGRLDVFGEQQAVDYVTRLNTILKLVPTGGAPSSLVFENAYGPTARSVRFGDAQHESIALEYDVLWVTGSAHHLSVVEIDGGKPVWRHATHVTSGKKHAVEIVVSTFSGGPQSSGRKQDGELLQVSCGQATPKKTCTSLNRVFFVREGRWWWNEREGSACVPKDNGWCAAHAATFPDRSEFPSNDAHFGGVE